MYKRTYLCTITDVECGYLTSVSTQVIVLMVNLTHKERNNLIQSTVAVPLTSVFTFNEIDDNLLMKLKIFFIGKYVEVTRVNKGKQHWELSKDVLVNLYNEFCNESGVSNE